MESEAATTHAKERAPGGRPPGAPPRRWWRQVILLLLFVGLTVFAVSQFTSAQQFARTMRTGLWYWGLVSALVFTGYFCLFALLYRLGLQIVNVRTTARHMLPVLLGSIFINTVVPIGAAAGGTVFVEDSIEHRQSGARTAAGVVLVLALDLITSLPFIVAALAIMGVRDTLQSYHIVVSVLFLGFTGLLTAALWLGRVRERWLERFLGLFQRVINWVGGWFKRPSLVSDEAVAHSARQFSDASASIARQPGILGAALLVGLVMHAVNQLGLYTLFLTYHQNVDLGTLTAGMGMSIVFYVITITPQGSGAVEGVMSLVFTSMGIASQTAIVVAISYRILNIWLPILLGYFFIRRMSFFRRVA